MGGIGSIGNLTSMDMHGTSIACVSDLISFRFENNVRAQVWDFYWDS